MKHVLPDLDAAVVQQIVALRTERARKRALDAGDHSVFVEGNNLSLIEGELDEDELRDLKKVKQDYVNAVLKSRSSKAVSAPSAGQGANVGAGSSASARASASDEAPSGVLRLPTTRIVPEALETSSKAYKPFLSAIRGCSLSLDTKWHNRWAVTYPTVEPPHSNSACFGPKTGLSVQQAFKAVARWAWRHHSEAIGETCPCSLDD